MFISKSYTVTNDEGFPKDLISEEAENVGLAPRVKNG